MGKLLGEDFEVGGNTCWSHVLATVVFSKILFGLHKKTEHKNWDDIMMNKRKYIILFLFRLATLRVRVGQAKDLGVIAYSRSRVYIKHGWLY